LFIPKRRSMWETSRRTKTLTTMEKKFKEGLGGDLKEGEPHQRKC
jgi:hypothetical protein